MSSEDYQNYLKAFDFFCGGYKWYLEALGNNQRLLFMSKTEDHSSDICFFLHKGVLKWSAKFYDDTFSRYVADNPSLYRDFLKRYVQEFLSSDRGRSLDFVVHSCKKSHESKFLWRIYEII